MYKKASGKIPADFRGGASNSNGRHFPNAIFTSCPHCGERGVFTFSTPKQTHLTRIWATAGNCPGCVERVEFAVFYSDAPEGEILMPTEVVAAPPPQDSFEPVEYPSDFPVRVARAISDAEQSYRSGLYSPALTCAGRALEGVLAHLNEADGKQILYNQIENLCESEKASAPLRQLSHAIRQGRNVGAHFDEEIEAEEQSARLLIEFLRYLVGYFFLLPEKVVEFEVWISQQNESSDV